MAAVSCLRAAGVARASWDMNPNARPLVKPPTKMPSKPATLPSSVVVVEKPSQLLSSNGIRSHSVGKVDEKYMGFERWLPVAPKVKKPRSIYNATSLAYMGDCIYEFYARRHFLFPPLSINDYNERVMKVVRCEAQDALLKKLLDEDFLTQEERDVLRWGKNISSNKTRTTKRAGVAVYNRASSLETLVGYLYLTDVKRLEELMRRLGFSTGVSSELITEMRKNFQREPMTPQKLETSSLFSWESNQAENVPKAASNHQLLMTLQNA